MQQKNSYPIVDAVTMATFPCNLDIAIVDVVKFLMHWKLEFMMISYLKCKGQFFLNAGLLQNQIT